MSNETYKAKSGNIMFRPVMTEDEYQVSDNEGFCISCGEYTDGVEPDARRYTCDHCGKLYVFGLEELLMMGLLKIK